MVDVFTAQLSPVCYVSCGTTRIKANGLNCTCACGRSFIYRSTQGKHDVSTCSIRGQTHDCSGGNTLEQIEAVALDYGVHGMVYKPGNPTTLLGLVKSRRYGAIWQIHYSVVNHTAHDASRNAFSGNHAIYLSGPGTKTGTIRVMDPLADGRYTGCPKGYQDWPESLVVKGAAALDVRRELSDPYKPLGAGKAYAYLTPADPITAAPTYKATVTVEGTRLWNDATKRWVYRLAKGTVLTVRGAKYTKGGTSCYPVTGPAPYQPSYFVPRSNVRLG